jgi:ABC-type polysaccharide/polyol phosphate export permease
MTITAVPDTSAADGFAESAAKRAFADLHAGLLQWQLWGLLGWQSIRERYRRSSIGPFWVTLSMALLIGGLGIMYSGLFALSTQDYIPYIAVGFIVWSLISGLITDGCACFFTSAPLIRQLPSPLSVYVYRSVWRNLLTFLHNSTILIVVFVIYGLWPGAVNILLAALAVAIICFNGVWFGLLLGTLSARLRDVPPIVTNLIQVAFFLTPIFWHPNQLGERGFIVTFNPFAYFLEIVRKPLLSGSIDVIDWIVVAAITLVGSITAFLFFARYRPRIAYWV